MTHCFLENPNELIHYIIGANNNVINNIKINTNSINSTLLNDLITYTMLPTVLIEIVKLYINEDINLCIRKNILEARNYYSTQYVDQRIHMHYKLFTNNNSNTHSFSLDYCIVSHLNDLCLPRRTSYRSVVCCCLIDNNIFEYKIARHRTLFNTDLDSVFKTFNENIVQYRIKYQCDDVHKQDYEPFDMNSFFNCFSNTTKQYHNLIERELSSNHIIKNCYSTYIIEECKYDSVLDCYNSVLICGYQVTLVQYKINNHKNLTDIISINKLLFEIIDKQTKPICDNYTKAQRLIFYHYK